MSLNQLEMFELPNPCIGVCESGPRGYCRGCLRSRDERFQWYEKPETERAHILKLIAGRQKRRELFLRQQAQLEKDEQEGRTEPKQDQLDLL